jgi:membrane protein DedA with SNARE-associated domain
VLALLNPTSLVASFGYAAVFILSALQSCCVPTSSELTLGFAGVLAAEGKLSLPGVIAVGVLGELVGAYVAWVIGRSAGRVVVDRYGKYILLSHRDLDRAEDWYKRHPRWGVFGSRLLPVIRNFVALPAGIAEVPAARFGILTFFGSLVWDTAMALIGYGVGNRWQTIMKGFSDAGYLLAALLVAAIAVFIWHRLRSYRAAAAGQGEGAPVRGRHLARRAGSATISAGPGAPEPSTPATTAHPLASSGDSAPTDTPPRGLPRVQPAASPRSSPPPFPSSSVRILRPRAPEER